jgi:hypothetical protein
MTINVEINPQDADPTQTVVDIIDKQDIEGAIVRLQLNLSQNAVGQIRDNAVKEALKNASYFSVSKNIKRENRIRLASRAAEEIDPSEALQAWLDSTKIPGERAKLLMSYGKELISKVQ